MRICENQTTYFIYDGLSNVWWITSNCRALWNWHSDLNGECLRKMRMPTTSLLMLIVFRPYTTLQHSWVHPVTTDDNWKSCISWHAARCVELPAPFRATLSVSLWAWAQAWAQALSTSHRSESKDYGLSHISEAYFTGTVIQRSQIRVPVQSKFPVPFSEML